MFNKKLIYYANFVRGIFARSTLKEIEHNLLYDTDKLLLKKNIKDLMLN